MDPQVNLIFSESKPEEEIEFNASFSPEADEE
jgi:hypothetical protein